MSSWPGFPSRRRTAHANGLELVAAAEPPKLLPSTLYRLVMGVDDQPVPMPKVQFEALGDPLAALFQKGSFPMTVFDVLDALNVAGLVPMQKSYAISESGQIPTAVATALFRDTRIAVTRGDNTNVDLLISSDGRNPAGFLQIAAWDGNSGLFNYYMRVAPTWVWAGNSLSALEDPSRGQGCFDSHVNGSVVMKELKLPWLHWKSMKASFQLAPDDPLLKNPLYTNSIGAEDLEVTVRAAVARWTKARLAKVIVDGQLQNAKWLLRQLFTTTTVNLASTDTESSVAAALNSKVQLTLPSGFWLNADALLDILNIPATPALPTAPASLYAAALKKFGFKLQEGAFKQVGDTFFAFPVPEAALEDNEVIKQMVGMGLITERFAACSLMVDFPNPVFSERRAQLLQYVPDTVPANFASGGISDLVAKAIISAAPSLPAQSPEAEFATNWNQGDNWSQVFASRIEKYMASVTSRVTTQDGFDDYTRLAESRRQEFKAMRLNEFALTLPTTDIHADQRLKMDEAGMVSFK